MIWLYRESGAFVAQVAKDFGASPSCLKWWLAIDELTATHRANALFDAHRDDEESAYRFLVDATP